jgi:hypothetical protein
MMARRCGDDVVGSAAPFEPGDQITEGGSGPPKPLGGEQLFGNPHMQQLPGDVGPSRPGAPPQNGLRLGKLLNRFEGRQGAVAGEVQQGQGRLLWSGHES